MFIPKCGLVGLPNVGKSTLFNCLVKGNSKISNFPFCTIKRKIGIFYNFNNLLCSLLKILDLKNAIPSFLTFVDIAGLIYNSHKGRGLGNSFLNDICDVNIICHIVRCFDDDSIVHINGKIDPIKDINLINNELILYDMIRCERIMNNLKKKNVVLMKWLF